MPRRAGTEARAACPTRCTSSRSSASSELELFGVDASFTNSALFMLIAACLITLFTVYAMRRARAGADRLQSVAELSYEFIANMMRDNVGHRREAISSRSSSRSSCSSCCEHARHVALLLHRDEPHHRHLRARRCRVRRASRRSASASTASKFLKLFVPSGVPVVLLPLLVVIEVISYLTRPISLSVRLFANMMAGHTMLKVFGGFVRRRRSAFSAAGPRSPSWSR